jgi:hypothetical protein
MTDRKRRTPSLDIVEVFDPDPARVARAVRLLLAIDLDAPARPPDTIPVATPCPPPDAVPDADGGQARAPPSDCEQDQAAGC